MLQGAFEPDQDDVTIRPERQPDGTWRAVAPTTLAKSDARDTIKEFMIAAGSAAGRILANAGVAAMSRVHKSRQVAVRSDPWAEDLPTAASHIHLRRMFLMMLGATFAVQDSGHSGLGVSSYVQVTSPIRRFGDLVAHAQLKAILRGEEPPFSHADLMSMAVKLTNQTNAARRLDRIEHDRWAVRYLEQERDAGRDTWQGVVSGFWNRGPNSFARHGCEAFVWLPEACFTALVSLDRLVRAGEEVTVRINSTDWQVGRCQASEIH